MLKLDIQIVSVPGNIIKSTQYWPSLKDLHFQLFEQVNTELTENDMETKYKGFLWLAVLPSGADEVFGFKFGYEKSCTNYYSSSGGVHPDHRNRGLASNLLQAQHKWAQAEGYKYVSTVTKNAYRQMLLLNIKNGFDVVGIETSPKGEPLIHLRKSL